MLVTVTHSTDTTHTELSSSLGSPTLVGSLRALTQPLRLLRLLQLLSTCITFSLVANMNAWKGFMGNWYMFTWCFCFAVTLLILLVELAGLQARFPLSWINFPFTYACYAAQSRAGHHMSDGGGKKVEGSPGPRGRGSGVHVWV